MDNNISCKTPVEFWKDLNSNILFSSEFDDILDVGDRIWQRGWGEANAGNLSFRLSESCLDIISKHWQGISSNHEDSVFDYLWILLSASGSRFRDYPKTGFNNFVIAGYPKNKTTPISSKELIIYPENRKPTSEWMTHMAIQNYFETTSNHHRVVLHTHATECIILSNLAVYQNNKNALEKEVRKYLPEIDIYFPGTISLLPYEKPGSEALAKASLAAFQSSDAVVWERHGVLTAGEDINQAFDYMETINKAVVVFLSLNGSRG
jgi:rhamnulose-1-phosphate aldolase